MAKKLEEDGYRRAAPGACSEATEGQIEKELKEKTADLEGLINALKQSNELISDMKKFHILNVSHEREVELEGELRVVEEEWQREKEELQVELRDISEINKELERDVLEKRDTI